MTTLLSFVFFTGLVGLATWWLTRKQERQTADGYFLAGRSLGFGVIAGSLLLTNLSTEQLVGLNGDAFRDGLAVMAWEVIAAISLVAMAIFFLPRYLRRGITTIPQFLAGRYDDTTQAITNFIFILAYMMILLPIILYTGATGLKGILSISELTGISDTAALWLTVWVIGTIGSIYAIFGGLRSVAVSDTLNGFGLLVGGVLITYFGLQLVGDGNPLAGLDTIRDTHPEKFDSLGTAETSVPWPTLFTGVLLLNLFYWTTNQQIIQRTFAASTLAEGQKGVLLAAMFKVMTPIILVVPGIVAFHLDSQGALFKESHIDTLATAVEAEYQQLPPEARVDGRIDGLTEEEWRSRQLQSKKGDRSYGVLVGLVLPPRLTGFFAAVVVGAILSSFNSALNATATMFSLGVYRRYMHPGASDRQTVRAGRVFGTAIAVAAMTGAPFLAGQESIFGYLQAMNGLYFIPLFAVVLVGMLSRRVPAVAANVALVLGVAIIAAGYFVPALQPIVEMVHGFHFLGIVFVFLILLMLVMGMMSPRSDAEIAAASARSIEASSQPTPETSLAAEAGPDAAPEPPSRGEKTAIEPAPEPRFPTSAVDMQPWPLAVPAGGLLVVVVLLIYAYFAF